MNIHLYKKEPHYSEMSIDKLLNNYGIAETTIRCFANRGILDEAYDAFNAQEAIKREIKRRCEK